MKNWKTVTPVAQQQPENRHLGGITRNESVINSGKIKWRNEIFPPNSDSERLIILDHKYESWPEENPKIRFINGY